MPATGINVVVTGFTTQMVKNIEGNMTLEFYVEERIGEREPSDFWLKVRHNANHVYLSNKTNAINQTGRCTNALLVGVINYQEPDINTNVNNEKIFGKHILTLEDLTMITTNNNNSNTITSTQSVNVPWLSQKNSPSRTRKNNRSVRPTTPKTPQKGRATLSRMGATTTRRSQNLQAALEANPIPIT